MDWDSYFMNIAHCVKLRSKDPKKQVGSVLVSLKNNRIISTGYNSVQSGLDDSKVPWHDRDRIHNLVIHSEVNAILYSESKYENTILYTTLSPCLACLKIVSASGIKKIVFEEKHKSFETVKELCKFFGITIQQLNIQT